MRKFALRPYRLFAYLVCAEPTSAGITVHDCGKLHVRLTPFCAKLKISHFHARQELRWLAEHGFLADFNLGYGEVTFRINYRDCKCQNSKN